MSWFARPTARSGLRVAAVGVACTTALAAASVGASAAPVRTAALTSAASPGATFVGSTSSEVVSLALNLSNLGVPVGSLSALPIATLLPGVDLTKPITLGLITSAGQSLHPSTTTAADSAGSNAALANGTFFDSNGVLHSLNRVATASLGQPSSNASLASISSSSLPMNLPLNLSLAALSAAVDPATLGGTGHGQLAGVDFAQLSQVLPASITNALSGALGAVNSGPGATLQSALSTLLGAVQAATAATPAGTAVDPVLTALRAQVTALQAALPTILNAKLVNLSGLDVGQSITPTATNLTSSASAALAHLNLLGGLITLDGFTNSVTATAGGTPGSATATAVPNVAQVQVGTGLLGVQLGPQGLLTSGALAGLSGPVAAAYNAVITALNGVLNAAGVEILPATYTHDAAADGSRASASSSGLEIAVFAPTASSTQRGNDANAYLVVKVGAAAASAQRQIVTQAVAAPAPVTPALAHTGANPALAGAAALLVGGGVVLTRRRRRG